MNEDKIWTPGQTWDVVDSPIGTLGFLICFEMWPTPGPELASQGATLLVTSSAWNSSYPNAYENCTTNNALQAKRWHVVSDQVGATGYHSALGRSRVVDPQGRVVCDTGPNEGMVIWETDLVTDIGTL